MIDRLTADILFIVIVLIITAILGFLIGYFSRKKSKEENSSENNSKINELEEANINLKNIIKDKEKEIKSFGLELKKLEEKNENLRFDLAACKENLKHDLAVKKDEKLKAEVGEEDVVKEEIVEDVVEKKLVFDVVAAKNAFGKKIIADDLKIVEGIGPKIESILKNNGIDTWYKLSVAEAEDVTAMMLKDGGERYRLHDPKTWGQQALLAFEGKWEELKKLQDELDGGR